MAVRTPAFGQLSDGLRPQPAARTPEGRDSAAREAIETYLEDLEHLGRLIQTPSLDLAALRACRQGDDRAIQRLHTHARHLHLDLVQLLDQIDHLLTHNQDLSLREFATQVMPHLAHHIDRVALPDDDALDPSSEGEAFAHEMLLRCHYAVSVRTALTAYALAPLTAHYAHPPAFRSYRQARDWVAAFYQLTSPVDEVVETTRALLRRQYRAARQLLQQRQAQLSRLTERHPSGGDAFARQPPDWQERFQAAQAQLLSALSTRAEQLDAFPLSALDVDGSGPLGAIGRRLFRLAARRAPGLGLGVALLASTTFAARHTLYDTAPPIRQDAPQGTTQSLPETDTLPSVETRSRPNAESSAAQTQNQTRASDSSAPASPLRGNASDSTRSAADASSPGARPSAPSAAPSTSQAARSERIAAIAGRFGLSPEQLLAANPGLDDPALVEVGQIVRIPALTLSQRQRLAHADEAVPLDATLDQLAQTLDLAPDALARLNAIDAPGERQSWRYQGQALTLPNRILSTTGPDTEVVEDTGRTSVGATAEEQQSAVSTDPPSEEVAASPSDASAAEAVPAEPESPASAAELLRDGEVLTPYRVQAGESLADIARAFQLSSERLMAVNALEEETLTPGQRLFIPSAPTPRRIDPGAVTARGYTRSELVAVEQRSAADAAPRTADGRALAEQYGATVFASLDEMPPEVRTYFTTTIQEIAAFFDVRPGDIMSILRMENNGAGWRLYQPATSSAGAKGVAQVVPRTWNGWSNPDNQDRHLSSMADIVTYGGLGFDWSARDRWLAWQQGRLPLSALRDTDADPLVFEDSVAAVARHLQHWGLTTDRAQSDPGWFQRRLQDAIAVYNSGRVLAKSASFTQSAANTTTVAQYVEGAIETSEALADQLPAQSPTASPSPALVTAFELAYDEAFGIDLAKEEARRRLAQEQLLLHDLQAGKLTQEQALEQLIGKIEQHFLARGRAAREAGERLPWPFVYNVESLQAQRLAVRHLGHMLDERELEQLLEQTGADLEAIDRRLAQRADAQLATLARSLLAEAAGERPVRNSAVTALVQPVIAGHNPYTLEDGTLAQLEQQVRERFRREHDTVETPAVAARFAVTPLKPMPRVVKAFGVPVNYQRGGTHTGIDVALPPTPDASGGREPPLYAVDDATVAYVGPLYCDQPGKCRGDDAIILDHGDNLYSIYSHNSAAYVSAGERVTAGQLIGRQGNEGYSFGSHLHFEVHVGAAFSGDWRDPWQGGAFVDPLEFLPEG